MTTGAAPRRSAAELAAAACAAFAVDPVGIGGVRVHAHAGPPRDAWLAALAAMLPPDVPLRKLPAGATLDRVIGGLDLPGTLAAGRPVLEPGVLTRADGGVVVAAMAERMDAALAGPIAAAMDRGVVAIERDGLGSTLPARFGLVLLDEGEEEEAPPASLLERCGVHLELALLHGDADFRAATREETARARERLPRLADDEAGRAALVRAAAQLGVPSLRAPLQALAVARALAALEGLDAPEEEQLALATALVLLPRATSYPPPPDAEAPPPPPDDRDTPGDAEMHADDPLADRVVEAARAALPPGLLELLARAALRGRAAGRARHGAETRVTRHGRAVGSRRGDPRRGPRLDLLATVRTAAPWQRVRGRPLGDRDASLRIHRDDLRVRRLTRKVGTTVVFAVDASGSAALARLNEAKGAVELLLAESYVRRDRVALIAFRGTTAELVLPPTRSLARARRTLAGMPGGGGTPLATALDVARQVCESVRRGGGSPLVVLLTDGRANVRRDGTGGRPQAEAEAREAARLLAGLPGLVVDASARPNPFLRELAGIMGASYLPLPTGDAASVGRAVQALVGGR